MLRVAKTPYEANVADKILASVPKIITSKWRTSWGSFTPTFDNVLNALKEEVLLKEADEIVRGQPKNTSAI
jgi:hypothetical protein